MDAPSRDSTSLRYVGWLLVGAVLLAVGCVTALEGSGGGGPGGSSWPEGLPSTELQEAVDAEVEAARAQLRALASLVREEQARLAFTFWVERGAFTLTSYSSQRRGAPSQPASEVSGLDDALRAVLGRYALGQPGQLEVVLRSRGSSWEVDSRVAHPAARPPEAKTLPVRRSGMAAATVQALTAGTQELLREVRVPEGGAVAVDVEVQLDDGRVTRWEQVLTRTLRLGSGHQLLEPSGATRAEVVWALMPFTQGIGPRTVRLTLRLEHRTGEAQPYGWVEEASVERPVPPRELNAAFVGEYRRMHESILRRWREETQEGAEWVARQGLEEAALWYAGGLFLKGGAYLVGWSGSVIRRALGRGGEAAAGWLRTALARLPREDKQAFEQLWRKVELEGEETLTTGEKGRLRGLMEAVERAVQERLSEKQKEDLRRVGRTYYKKLHPELEQLLDEAGNALPIHHRCPLEYAHLFPAEDINASSNLVMVRQEAHKSINRAWGVFRKLRPSPTAKEVKEAAQIIDGPFEEYYHRAVGPAGEAQLLESALNKAVQALEHSFSP